VTAPWDADAWARLAAELDRWPPRAATLWWRDDDAGAAAPALARLLALAAALEVPLALAVVPAWLTDAATALIHQAPPGVTVLQHGYAHRNHERPGPGQDRIRRAELGPARPVQAALAELAAGRARLARALPHRLRAVLVPPWNRIAPALRDALPGAGYHGLSTFGPRPAAPGPAGLRVVNCHVDPILWRSGRRFAGAAATLDALAAHLAARRTGAVDPAEPTGLLTHHRDLAPTAWEALATLLDRLRRHPAVAFPPLDAFLGPPGTGP
jgi:peptidoglycan/xylan/chitin deacetylase (PgdA/CDA1 family)